MFDITAQLEDHDGGPHVVSEVVLPAPSSIVFDAVATGEGISSWFVPCALEPHPGGRVVQFADPGAPDPTSGPEAAVEATLTATLGEVTVYAPPERGTTGVFEYAEHHWMGEGVPVPPWVTRMEVRPAGGEAGGAATALTLTSGFASGGPLPQTAAAESLDGWRDALHVLAHRLTHRSGAGVVTVLAATDPLDADVPAVWRRVLDRLDAGIAGRVRTEGVSGSVLTSSEASVSIALSSPAEGIVQVFAFPSGASVDDASSRAALAVRVHEYVPVPGGDGSPLGAAAVDAMEPTWDAPRWRGWLETLGT